MGPDPVPGHPTPGMHIWGWMAPAELEWLRATAATMGSVVEVGSLRGRSAFALLTGCPGLVYCIDPWDDHAGHCLPAFMDDCGHFPNLVAVQGFSPQPDVMAQIPEQVDMVFIDGAHDAVSVTADIDGWLPRTQRLLCGHDYMPFEVDNPGYPDVRAVVNERFGDLVRVAPETSIWTVDIAELA